MRTGGVLAAVAIGLGVVLLAAGCGSSSDASTGASSGASSASTSSTAPAVSGRKFCAAAQTVKAANAGQLDHILTREEAQARLESQLKLLAASASPDQGAGWAGVSGPLDAQASRGLSAALADCHLTLDIFGVAAAKSDVPATSKSPVVPPTTG